MKQKKKTNKFLDGRNANLESKKDSKDSIKTSKNNFLGARLKAFITDMFLINMPLLYFATYVVLGSKDAFQNNQFAIFICVFLYCFILVLFFYFAGQTPGFRYAEIMLVDKDSNKKPNFLQCNIYVFIWLIETSFFLWIFSFIRKDKKTLHELLSKTKIIYKQNVRKAKLS